MTVSVVILGAAVRSSGQFETGWIVSNVIKCHTCLICQKGIFVKAYSAASTLLPSVVCLCAEFWLMKKQLFNFARGRGVCVWWGRFWHQKCEHQNNKDETTSRYTVINISIWIHFKIKCRHAKIQTSSHSDLLNASPTCFSKGGQSLMSKACINLHITNGRVPPFNVKV